MFDHTKYHLPLDSYMKDATLVVFNDERMEEVMRQFEESGAWNLPVVNREGEYLGFVSKSHIFFAYRARLQEVSHD